VKSNKIRALTCWVSQVFIKLVSATEAINKTLRSHRNVYVTCISKKQLTVKSRWWTNLTYAMSIRQPKCYSECIITL